MASALEELTQNTTADNPASFYDYYNSYRLDKYGLTKDQALIHDPYSLIGKIDDFFLGDVSSAKQAYDNYLARLQNAYTANREDTAIQRQTQDAIKAGFNPMILLSGNAPSGSSSSASAELSRTNGSKSSKGNSLLTSALKLLAILALKG